MPSLRGHHLICLHFFNGEGYNKAFVENLHYILRIAGDGEIEICPGVDDICRRCPYLQVSRCQYNEDAEEEIREMDNKALELLKVTTGAKIKWNGIKEMMQSIFPQWYASFCISCNWRNACEKDEFFQRLKSEILRA